MIEVRQAREGDVIEACTFLTLQNKVCAGWDKNALIAWLLWMHKAVLVGGVWNDGKLESLCIGRPTNDAQRCLDDRYHLERDGKVAWIDFYGGNLVRDAKDMMKLAFGAWGWGKNLDDKKIAFNRFLCGRTVIKQWRANDVLSKF